MSQNSTERQRFPSPVVPVPVPEGGRETRRPPAAGCPQRHGFLLGAPLLLSQPEAESLLEGASVSQVACLPDMPVTASAAPPRPRAAARRLRFLLQPGSAAIRGGESAGYPGVSQMKFSLYV